MSSKYVKIILLFFLMHHKSLHKDIETVLTKVLARNSKFRLRRKKADNWRLIRFTETDF